MFLINDCCTTISDHFFANCMFIFPKIEVQTIILRCLMSLNLNWYNSFDKKHKNAKTQKTQTSVFGQNYKNKVKWKYLHFVS